MSSNPLQHLLNSLLSIRDAITLKYTTELNPFLNDLMRCKLERQESPGSVQELHNKFRGISPNPFDGAQFILNRNLSESFMISHVLSVRNKEAINYRLGATFVGNRKHDAPTEAFPILQADTNFHGATNTTIYHKIAPRWFAKCVTQSESADAIGAEVSLEFNGVDSCSSILYATPELGSGTNVFLLQYLKSVTSYYDLGAELSYQSTDQLPGGQQANISLAARYNGVRSTASLIWSGVGTQLCVHHSLSEVAQFGFEMSKCFLTNDFMTKGCLQYEIPQQQFICRGSLDNSHTCTVVLQKNLHPLPVTFSVSVRYNHYKEKLKLGFSLGIYN